MINGAKLTIKTVRLKGAEMGDKNEKWKKCIMCQADSILQCVLTETLNFKLNYKCSKLQKYVGE